MGEVTGVGGGAAAGLDALPPPPKWQKCFAGLNLTMRQYGGIGWRHRCWDFFFCPLERVSEIVYPCSKCSAFMVNSNMHQKNNKKNDPNGVLRN